MTIIEITDSIKAIQKRSSLMRKASKIDFNYKYQVREIEKSIHKHIYKNVLVKDFMEENNLSLYKDIDIENLYKYWCEIAITRR